MSRLEERLSQGAVSAAPAAPAPSRPAGPVKAARTPAPAEDIPPWEEERPPLPPEPEEEPSYDPPVSARPAPPAQKAPAPGAAQAPSADTGENRAFWPSFAAGLRGKVPPSVTPYLNNPAKVTGIWKNGALTLWVDSEFTRTMLNKPAVLEGLTQAAAASFGGQPRVSIVTGKPPQEEPQAAPAEPEGAEPLRDALDELLAFGEQFDNIVIQ